MVAYNGPTVDVPKPGEKVMELLTTKPRIINVGLQSFTESIVDYGGETVQFNWRPRANGNKKMIKNFWMLWKITVNKSKLKNHKVTDKN